MESFPAHTVCNSSHSVLYVFTVLLVLIDLDVSHHLTRICPITCCVFPTIYFVFLLNGFFRMYRMFSRFSLLPLLAVTHSDYIVQILVIDFGAWTQAFWYSSSVSRSRDCSALFGSLMLVITMPIFYRYCIAC